MSTFAIDGFTAVGVIDEFSSVVVIDGFAALGVIDWFTAVHAFEMKAIEDLKVPRDVASLGLILRTRG